jgi:7-hydroxymethyl chlorophyll a reductase
MAERRAKARPVAPGGTYPAKEHCSQCGLCDTPYIAHVKEACAFLGDGMARLETLEPAVHGRGRDLTNDEMRLGVVDEAGPNTSIRFSLTFTKLFVPRGTL